ncbi:thioredoxin H-type-like [Miscanthus floridulus]|uniref:thioredoxin H-type-like n=1 Tax=Miscanthus floridulus TaxID=154761 RepID=UPI0034587E04
MAGAEGTVIACHTRDEFDAQMAKAYEADKLVVIDFMSLTCGPCQAIAPVFEECAKEYPTKGVFLKVDILELEEVAKSYNIQAAPTFVFIRDDLTLESFVGAYPDKLCNTIKEFIDNTSAASASSASGDV